MTNHCREYLRELPPRSRDSRCSRCRPDRTHRKPKNRTPWRDQADKDFDAFLRRHGSSR
ncbi:hypothetical protein ACI8AA_06885 [Geodermatophilus sp. SYSU D01180]